MNGWKDRWDDLEVEAQRIERDLEETRDYDQPTWRAHARHVKALRAEFSPIERQRIRYMLGLEP